MLVNIIQNTISSFISAGVAAAEVITTNLKMWLGFETSETLGRELAPSSLSIENGSGGGTITQISENSYSSSSDGNNSSTIRPKFDFNTESGKTYKLVITPTGTISGTVHFDFNDGVSYLFQDYDFTTTKEIYFTDNGQVFGAFNGQQVYNITGFTISLKELTQITPDKSGNNNAGELFTGKALDFDGSNDKVDIDFTTQIKSAVFWVKPLDTGVQSILGFGGAFSGSKYIKSVNNNIQSAGLSSVSVYVNGVSTTSVPVNQWSRVVVNFALLTPQELTFGYGFDTYGYIELSDVQLYDENLSADDIAYDYANPQNLVTDRDGTSIELSNLKGYWAMSEGAGSLVYDSSGEGNNGTINGATYIDAQPRIPQLGMQNWSKGSNLFPYSEDFTEWVINSSTSQVVLAPQEAAPYGQGDVYSIIMQSSEIDAYIRYATTNATLTSSTHSVWVKQAPTGSATHIRISTNNRANWNTGTSQKIALTSSWQRLETTDGITGNRFTVIGSADVGGIQDPDCIGKALIYGAQLLEGSSAGVYRFTDGAATSNSIVIPNPTIPTQDIFGNLVRDRLNSFNLDGSGYAEVADADDLDFGAGDFSVEAWVRFEFKNQGSAFNVIYCNGNEFNDSNTFSLSSNSSSKISFIVNNTSCNSTSTFSLNEWVHVVGTRIQGLNGLKLYINGNTTPEDTATNNNTVTNSFDKTVGYDTHSSRYYYNIISDVRVYSQALTSEEVENNYNAGLSAHTN